MINNVWSEKRKNLISNTKNSPELFNNSDDINLSYFFNYNDLLNFVENKAINELRIDKNELINKITDTINSCKDENEIVNALKILHFDSYQFDKSLSLVDIQKKIIDGLLTICHKRIDELLDLSLKAKIRYYDTSVWTLYLSYGILKGVITFAQHDDLIVQAPLINIEVEFIKDENGIFILKKLNDELHSNEILELSLSEMFDKKTDISSSLKIDNFNANEYFNYFSNLFKTLKIDNDFSNVHLDKKDVVRQSQELIINKSFTIGLLNPIGGKMLRDFDEISSTDYQFPTYDTIFHSNLDHLIYEKDDILEINNPLNLVQKLAVANSQNKNILIYGPPGTGKSEVVVNLITNLLMNNKTMFVISEKKAALDVLDQRLFSLKVLAMNTFDEKNSNTFYEKIVELNHLIISNNKVNLSNNNVEYLKLLEYRNIIENLHSYKDINNVVIYDFLKKYDSISIEQYKKFHDTIVFIYNKLKNDKTSLFDFIEKVKLFKEAQTYYDSQLGVDVVKQYAYDYQRVNEFLNNFKNVDEKHQKFVLAEFLLENKILDKKPLLKFESKIHKNINVEQTISLLNKIVDNKLKFIINSNKIYPLLSESELLKNLLSLYDWQTNTKLSQYIELLKNDNIFQSIVDSYWSKSILKAKTTDKIIRDKFISYLKETLLNNHELETKWTELVRKANLNKKPNINKTIKEYYELLKLVFPIWIISPDVATAIIPLKQNEFDYGIFDEASQMRIERALPLIYRCKYAIVSGDDKQLKPSSFFLKSNTLDESYDGDLDNVDSLLDKAKTSNWMNFTLSNHYRSNNEELIEFSNKYFYDDKLVCVTKNNNFAKAVDVINENGEYDRENNINPSEAKKVVQLLLDNVNAYKTMIVITFNIKQADYISQLASSNNVLAKKLDDLTLKVRSLENVQGDEADLVIISSTFGKDKNGHFLQNFGPINQDGGKNRINVMASRAKQKMIIVKSFSSGDITNDNNENVRVFKRFMTYVEEIENNKENSNIPLTDNIDFLSKNIIDELISLLTIKDKYVIEKNKKIGTHNIDIAISKFNEPNIVLSIFIDDSNVNQNYVTDKHNFIRQIDYQKYYQDRGYKTFKFNVLEWLFNKNLILRKLQQILMI